MLLHYVAKRGNTKITFFIQLDRLTHTMRLCAIFLKEKKLSSVMSRGLCDTALQHVYRTTVIARLTYGASARRGLASTSERQRIDSVIDGARRNGYCAPDLPSFDVLCDDELFSKAVRLSNHMLHFLLPRHPLHHTYNLRQCTHSLQLPDHTTHLSVTHICCTKTHTTSRYSS